jgi:hypothetical protein
MNPEPNGQPAPKSSAENSLPAPVGESSSPAGAEKKPGTDEQMAKYEEYLKETDWGHQPC